MDLSNYIVKYSEKSTKSDEFLSRNVINNRTEANITIDHRPLSKFFDRNFRIPDYQRDYQWTNKEWEELWRRVEIFLNYDHNNPSTQANDVFFGSMFLSERDGSVVTRYDIDGDVYDIIDGQQRITTVSILLKILSDVLVNELSGCSTEFISQYSQHVGLLNNHIYMGGEPDSGPSLIRQDGGVGLIDRYDNTFYEAIMKDDIARISHLLQRDQRHNNTRKGVIELNDYLSVFEISMDSYLSELLNDDNFEGVNRPNIPSSKMSEIRNANEPQDVSDDLREYLKENKIEFSKSEQNLLDAYEYFNERVDEILADCESSQSGEELSDNVINERKYRIATNIKNYLLNSFRIGYFKVNDRQPELLMRIFEVLNEHGVELKKTDLIRTRLVMHFRNESETEYQKYKSKWESVVSEFDQDPERVVKFLETFFVATENGVTSRGEVSNYLLEAFTEPSEQKEVLESRVGSISDAKSLVEELEIYAKYYHHLEDPLNYGFELDSERVKRKSNRILRRMRDADTDIWEPLVLAAYADVKKGRCEESALLSLLSTIESLVIRFSVAGSVNAKDSTYEKAIEAYDAHRLGDQVEMQLIETAYKNATSAFGEDVLIELMRNDWSNRKAGVVLRKIAAENLDEQSSEQMVHSRLEASNSQIHVEHIFPKSPLLEDEEKYQWVNSFFSMSDNNTSDDSDERSIEDILSAMISSEEDEKVKEVCSEFSQLLGNRVLLLASTNTSLSNSRYGRKLAGYSSTQGFSRLATSQDIVEEDLTGEHADQLREYGRLRKHLDGNPNWEELDIGPDNINNPDEKLEYVENEVRDLEPIVNEFNDRWTVDRVASNSMHLLRELIELLDFDNCTSDSLTFEDSIYNEGEFEDIDIETIVKKEIQGRRELIKYNYSQFA